MRAWALLLFSCMASAACLQAVDAAEATSSPAEIIADCGSEDADDAVGVSELEEFCPGIEHALVEAGYAPFISEDQFDELTTFSLVDLRHLSARYSADAKAAAAHDLDVARLDSVLRSLEKPAQADVEPGLLERFKRWLRKAFDRQQANPDSWINRWLADHKLPQIVAKVLGYILIVLVIAFAVGLLINELRAAGLLKRGARSRGDSATQVFKDRGISVPTWSDLDSLPLRDRPSMMLRMLVATLVQTGKLRTERGLTHRELASRVALDEAAQRESFQRIAVMGERTIYGGDNVPAEEIESVVAAGRTLNSQLLAATGKA